MKIRYVNAHESIGSIKYYFAYQIIVQCIVFDDKLK